MKHSIFTQLLVGFVIVIAVLTGFFFLALGDQHNALVLSTYLTGIAISIVISIIFSIFISIGARGNLSTDDLKTKAQSGIQGILKWLMNNFNLTFDQVNIMVNDLFDRKDEFNSILSSLQEGVLVLNDKGKITLYNDVFKKIAQTDSIEGQFYWDIIKEPEILEIIKKVTKEKTSLIQKASFLDRNYICRASFIDSSEKVVLTFFDITLISDQ